MQNMISFPFTWLSQGKLQVKDRPSQTQSYPSFIVYRVVKRLQLNELESTRSGFCEGDLRSQSTDFSCTHHLGMQIYT